MEAQSHMSHGSTVTHVTWKHSHTCHMEAQSHTEAQSHNTIHVHTCTHTHAHTTTILLILLLIQSHTMVCIMKEL